MPTTPFTVCTYNIRFILDRWPERKHLVEQELRRAKADLYSLQEVNVGHRYGQHTQLQATLQEGGSGAYACFGAPAARRYLETLPLVGFLFNGAINPLAALAYDFNAWFNERYLASILGPYVQWLYYNPVMQIVTFLSLGTAWVFGTAMYARESVRPTRHEQLLIGSWKVAQSVVVTVGDDEILVVNVHLSSARDAEHVRVEEARLICDWIEAQGVANAMIMGDFNGEPGHACYLSLEKRGFVSTHKKVHGAEPAITFHQGLEAPTKDVGEEICLDYIFFKGAMRPTAIRVIGTECSATDKTIYPSDHFGLVADFQVGEAAKSS
ncbi:Aste57867_18173 [Aphanomyces stellatus]|uniref:Aste57867_18173 protein n=1 Tax=Aphanomyces stellatus TaxID=120398 RepID=A0A485LAS4_9STRA|nr:hypothetical protein As57867_018111 [Aphanomyces stellatus]VFT94911.1 Aste57867_18173 [Aphanomyces stellatus]